MQGRSGLRAGLLAGAVGALLAGDATAAPARTRRGGAAAPDFQERVEAQRAIESVLWRHRLWPASNPTAKPPLSAVLDEPTLRENVRETLRKSLALATLWNQPITAGQLQAEIDRMVAESRDPGMLREMFEALGEDPALVAEILARPILADRLVRSAYSGAERFHGAVRRRAEAAAAGLRDAASVHAISDQYRERVYVLEGSEAASSNLREGEARVVDQVGWEQIVRWLADRLPPGTSRRGANPASPLDLLLESLHVGSVSAIEEDERGFTVVTLRERAPGRLRVGLGSWPKVPFETWWAQARPGIPGAIEPQSGSFVLPDSGPLPPTCPNDSWSPTGGPPATTPPQGRWLFTTVWTGAEMIVWGGIVYGGLGGPLDTGGRYSPATASWTPTDTSTAPSGRQDHTAVWTGTRMIVWGGDSGAGPLETGALYDPIGNTWSATSTKEAPDARAGHSAVWSGAQMLVWGGVAAQGVVDSGGRYDPAADTWTTLGGGAPAPRNFHTAVWTGTRMIVWGGRVGPGPTPPLGDSGIYDPASDAWSPVSYDGAPSPRVGHTAVWDGNRMIVWGGDDNHGLVEPGGARYSPSLDNWIPVADSSAPVPRTQHTAVWTGNEMIVWGGWLGAGQGFTLIGGRYRPDMDAWLPTSVADAPAARHAQGAVWASTRMLVWGGNDLTGSLDTGGVYCGCRSWYEDFDGDGVGGDAGAQTTTCDGSRPAGFAPIQGDCDDFDPFRYPGAFDGNCNGFDEDCDNVPDDDYVPVFHGCGLGVCLRFGAITCNGGLLTDDCVPGPQEEASDLTCDGQDGDCDGGIDEDFQPTEDHWVGLPAGPDAAAGAPGAWTGSEMLVWSGEQGGQFLPFGQRYAPSSNAWDVFYDPLGLQPRRQHTSVWTGGSMIIWGGDDTEQWFDDGGEYLPASDNWFPLATESAPTPRSAHTAVWTGTGMIVWGGADGVTFLRTGGLYEPSVPLWSATRTTGAPAARALHTAVWTGAEMIVWGGMCGSTSEPTATATGGRYAAATNSWSGTPTSGAPAARWAHTAIWTGTKMIVWGGNDATGGFLGDGGIYDPATNAWGPVSGVGAPVPRSGHTALWTGAEMIIWGGISGAGPLADGARYNPATDSWTPMTRAAAPGARSGAAAVWADSEMIVWGGDNGGALDTGGRYTIQTTCGSGGCQRVGLTSCSAGTVGFACIPGGPSPEVCDGFDNDCNVLVDDNIPAPGGALTMTSSWDPSLGLTLDWDPLPGANVYDVVVGSLPALIATGGDYAASIYGCIDDNDPSTSVNLGYLPIFPGDGLWFLVRGVNFCSGPGTYDGPGPPQVGLRDAEIQLSGLDCP